MERRNFMAAGLLAGLDAPSLLSLQFSPPELAGTDRGSLQPFYLPPSSEPLVPGPGGLNIRVKVRSNQTNVQFSCIEAVVNPKTMGPTPHLHKDLDELMFVQEGTVSVLVGEKVYKVEAGGWHLRPHGIVHTFWNDTDKPARFVDMFFNQDFENALETTFSKLIPDLIKRGVPFNSKEAIQQFDKLNTQYGVTVFDEQRQPIIDKYGLKG